MPDPATQPPERRDVLETVNGHDIRPISTGSGRLFEVGSTGRAFPILDHARIFAAAA